MTTETTDQVSVAVLVVGSLTLTDHRGALLVATRDRGRHRLIARTGIDLDQADVTSLVEFLGGRILTEADVVAQLQQGRYYDAVIEKAQRFNDVVEHAVREQVDQPTEPGTALFEARVLLGLDGGTGARDINAEVDGG